MTITLDKTIGQTTSPKMTLEEFLVYDDDTETLYEFEDGEIIPMLADSEINRRIASFLCAYFFQQGVSPYRLSMKTEVITTGSRVRVPDLVVLSEELASAMQGATRSIVTADLPAPSLVVEVVSPNQSSRDYRYKRSEYAARGIGEYWIVDSLVGKITVLEWIEGFYEEKVYEGEQVITSILFPEFKLTAAEILRQ